MQLHETAMSGPEFLQAVADQNPSNGLDINAEAFRQRAREWSAHLAALHNLREANDDLSTRIAEAQRVMRGA